ncbi:MAG: hypothetical protein WC663_05175 [Patescibacteria group bacterium]
MPIWRIMETAAKIANHAKNCSANNRVVAEICFMERSDRGIEKCSNLVQSTANDLLSSPPFNHFTVQLERYSRITKNDGTDDIPPTIVCSYYARIVFKALSA